jgi:hypothetical protein
VDPDLHGSALIFIARIRIQVDKDYQKKGEEMCWFEVLEVLL